MISILSNYIESIIDVFMDDFNVYGNTFDSCLKNLTLLFKRCMDTNLVLNWEKVPFYCRLRHSVRPYHFC